MIIVNPSTRQFNIPGADLVFGVTADAGSVTKEFSCPRYVGNNLDLTGCFIRMNYRNANGEVDSYLVSNVTVDGDNIVFGWELTPNVTMYKGNISFVMCVVGPDTKVKWHTTLGRGQVLEGLEPDSAMIEEGTADVVAALIAMVEAQTEAVEAEGSKQIKAVQTAAQTAQSDAVAQIEAKGVNTRNSIPADYTALSEAVETLNRGRAGAIVCSAEGSAVVVNDASDNYVQGLRIFGRSTQDGTPTPDVPVEIVSVENPTISVNEQTLNIPRTLPGIPVTSGGNYTDSDGQQWICDEVDLERGVYVQRIYRLALNGTTALSSYRATDNTETYIGAAVYGIPGMLAYGMSLCSFLPLGQATNPGYYPNVYMTTTSGGLHMRVEIDGVTDIASFKEWLKANPQEVQYALATSIETPLSETEIASYRALHSNYPNTTVLNDAGAHMVVRYAADTKLYIDNKIAAMIGG